MRAHQRYRGVTLIELVFSMGLLALLAGLAAPGFRASLRAAAVRSASYELLAGLQQTRASSILQSRPGLLCLADSAGECLAPAAPAKAWVSYLEMGPGEVGAGRQVLGGHSLPRGVMVRATRSPIRFWPSSFAASTGTLTICDSRNEVPPRAIIISQTGRARLAAGSPEDCLP